jgi:hypothetical protein
MSNQEGRVPMEYIMCTHDTLRTRPPWYVQRGCYCMQYTIPPCTYSWDLLWPNIKCSQVATCRHLIKGNKGDVHVHVCNTARSASCAHAWVRGYRVCTLPLPIIPIMAHKRYLGECNVTGDFMTSPKTAHSKYIFCISIHRRWYEIQHVREQVHARSAAHDVHYCGAHGGGVQPLCPWYQ